MDVIAEKEVCEERVEENLWTITILEKPAEQYWFSLNFKEGMYTESALLLSPSIIQTSMQSSTFFF